MEGSLASTKNHNPTPKHGMVPTPTCRSGDEINRPPLSTEAQPSARVAGKSEREKRVAQICQDCRAAHRCIDELIRATDGRPQSPPQFWRGRSESRGMSSDKSSPKAIKPISSSELIGKKLQRDPSQSCEEPAGTGASKRPFWELSRACPQQASAP